MRTKKVNEDKVNYAHTLRKIDYTIKCVSEEWFNEIEENDKVYVYLKSFPNDNILTGKYYQNCGQIYGDQRDNWLYELSKENWKIEKTDGSEVWEICIMTLRDLKDLLLREKGMQVILEEKYPGITY